MSRRSKGVLAVGRVEINHMAGHFTQVIIWEWIPERKNWHVQDWCHEKDAVFTSRSHLLFKGIKLRYKYKIETWTDYDPERRDARVFPIAYRSGVR